MGLFEFAQEAAALFLSFPRRRESSYYNQIKHLLTPAVLSCSLRAALQIYFHGIQCKAQKDTNGETISALKVGAKAGGPPFIGRGWGRKLTYQKNINKTLIFMDKYFRPLNMHERPGI